MRQMTPGLNRVAGFGFAVLAAAAGCAAAWLTVDGRWVSAAGEALCAVAGAVNAVDLKTRASKDRSHG